jgi:hypothetical protein
MLRCLAVLAIALAGSGLSACGSDSPATSQPSQSSTSTSGIAEPLPERPEISGYREDEGAIAFVKYYTELINYGYRTYDTRMLKEFSTAACGVCQRIYGTIDKLKAAGDTITGAQGKVISATIATGQTGPRLDVMVVKSATAGKAVDRTGKVTLSAPADDSYKTKWSLLWTEQAWKLADIVALDKFGQ